MEAICAHRTVEGGLSGSLRRMQVAAQYSILNAARLIATPNMHNPLPIRGTPVRDALSWSKCIGGALQRYGANSDGRSGAPALRR
jgi:hypothetical protein